MRTRSRFDVIYRLAVGFAACCALLPGLAQARKPLGPELFGDPLMPDGGTFQPTPADLSGLNALTTVPAEEEEEPAPEGLIYINEILQPSRTDYVQVAASADSCWALRRDGRMDVWNEYGWEDESWQSDSGDWRGPFVNRGFLAISAANDVICGRKRGGAMLCWGGDWYAGEENINTWVVEHISAGTEDTCALEAGGAMRCVPNEPESEWPRRGQFQQVDCGRSACCAVRDSHSVLCWGEQDWRPVGNDFVQVSVDGRRACAVRTDGRIACWSDDEDHVQTPALEGVVRISTHEVVCAVAVGGELLCWPFDQEGSLHVVAQGVVQVEVSEQHLCALFADGSARRIELSDELLGYDDLDTPQALPAPLQWIPDDPEDADEDDAPSPHKEPPNAGALRALLGEAYDAPQPLAWLHLGDATPLAVITQNPALIDPDTDSISDVPVGGAPTAWSLRMSAKGLTARDLVTGKQRWHRPMPTHAEAAISCASESQGVVMVVLDDGAALGLDAKTGAPRWSLPDTSAWEALCEAQSLPDSEGFGVLLPIEDEASAHAGELVLASLQPATGKVRWQEAMPFDSGGPHQRILADGQGVVAFRVLASTNATEVISLDAKGSRRWQWAPPKGQVIQDLALFGERVWVTVLDPAAFGFSALRLYALRRADGAPDPLVSHSFYTHYDAPSSRLWARPDVLVLVTGDGLLRVLDPGSGAIRWTFGVGVGFESMDVLGARGGSWFVAHTTGSHEQLDSSGVLLLPLGVAPKPVSVTVEGPIDQWGSLLIAGQRVHPLHSDHFKAEVNVAGFIQVDGFFNRCADPTALEGGELVEVLTIDPQTGYHWLPLTWSSTAANCP